MLSYTIFYKKLFKLQKMTDVNLKCYRFPRFLQILLTRQKNPDIQYAKFNCTLYNVFPDFCNFKIHDPSTNRWCLSAVI